jgi:hypothetical protein
MKRHPSPRSGLYPTLPLVLAAAALLLIACYKGHGLSPSREGSDISGIRGTITFTGEQPDSTREIRVAVLRAYPTGMTDPDSLIGFVLSNLVAFSDTIPRFADTYDYQLALPPDVYAWVVVVWFPDIPTYLFGVKELGAYYREGSSGETPTPVSVIPGTVTPDIHILADFANIHRDVPFFKPGRKP